MSEKERAASNESSSTPTFLLEQLPQDALSQVVDLCADSLTQIRQLAAASDVVRGAIFHQHWKCHRCNDPLFVASDLSTTKLAKPFVCGVCHGKFCGASIDYSKRHCRPQRCEGCHKVECYECQQQHLLHLDGYGTENYCQDCQAEFDFGMGGC